MSLISEKIISLSLTAERKVTFVSTDFGDACFDTGALYGSKPKSAEPERSSVIARNL